MARSSDAVRFSRVLRLSAVVAMAASVSVGLGIFDLFGEFVRLSGWSTAVGPYLITFALATPLILTYAERAGVQPGLGGAYYLSKTHQSLWLTFGTGWLLAGGQICVLALLGWGTAVHVNIILELFSLPILDVEWLAAGAIITLTILNVLATGRAWRARSRYVYIAIGFVALLFIRAFFVLDSVEPVTTSYLAPMPNLNLAALMLCTLWGINVILSSRNEIQRPTRTVLRSMTLTMALVGGLGILGALALYHYPGAVTHSLTPIIDLEAGFGVMPRGLVALVYAALALAINYLAINRILSNALSLLDVMTVDGCLPVQLQTSSFSKGSLHALLFLTLGAALIVNIASLEVLIGLASLTFLLATVLVHAPALIRPASLLPQNRRPKLPFHPLFPGLTVAVGVLVPIYLPLETLVVGAVWLAVGAAYFVAVARRRAQMTMEHDVTVGELDGATKALMAGYCVMVALVDGDQTEDLVRAGLRIAVARNGHLIVLRPLQLPEVMPVNLKHQAAQEAWQTLSDAVRQEVGGLVPNSVLVRIVASVADGIVNTASDESADMLIVGWDSSKTVDMERPDDVLNAVVRYARCDVGVLHGRFPSAVRRITVATAGGPNAPAAFALGQDLGDTDDCQLVLTTIVDQPTDADTESDVHARLISTVSGVEQKIQVDEKVSVAEDIQLGISSEAYSADLLLIGASKQGVLDRVLFGGLATAIARASQTPTFIARARERHRYPWLLRVYDAVQDPLPTLTSQRIATVTENMRAAAVPNVDFYVLIALAAVIASLGLLQNSVAVIIGAMLVAPLMSPILAMAMGMVIGEVHTLAVATEATVKGIALAILVGIVITIISPLDAATSEILARTEPNVLDLLVALASGAAAGYAICRKEVAAAMPGVAIAAALVPPLCVVGYGIGVSDFTIAVGAALLFITNLVAIILAAAAVFLALGFQPERAERGELARGLRITVSSLVVISVLLLAITAVTVWQLNRTLAVEAIFNDEVIANAGQVREMTIQREGDGFAINATILSYSDGTLTPEDLQQLESDLTDAVGGPVQIDAVVLSADRTDFRYADEYVATELAFTEAIESRSAIIDTMQTTRTSGGVYIINAVIIVPQNAIFRDDDLLDVQTEVSEAVGVPVQLDMMLLRGRQAQLEPIPTADPP